jgi:cytidine deaminase
MDRDHLLAIARKAALNAYAPYSHFRVGAALVVETAEGPRIVTGANIENASYGMTLCAERAALAAAISLYNQEQPDAKSPFSRKPLISQLAVACIDVQADAPAASRTPCGACRQWLAELAPKAVYYVDGIPEDLTIADLLPYTFYLDH